MIHLLHHANCADGFAAACIAHHALTHGIGCERTAASEIRVQPVNYPDKQQVPDGLFAGDHVYYLDYTPPQAAIDEILSPDWKGTVKLTVIDHHSKAAPLHARVPETGHLDPESLTTSPGFESVFNLHRSGAGLTWEYFHNTAPSRAVELIQYRDLGSAFDPALADDPRTRDALALHAYLFRCLPRSFEAWSPLLVENNGGLVYCLAIGDRLRSIDKGIIDAAVKNPHWLAFHGEGIPAVNGLAAGLVSDACVALLAAYPSAPFAASWYIDEASGRAVYSLRSRRGSPVNVSDIAASMATGGGGHPNAAGFSTPIPVPFV